MALLLFGGPHSSQGNWFGLRCSRLLFHLGRCALRILANERAAGLFLQRRLTPILLPTAGLPVMSNERGARRRPIRKFARVASGQVLVVPGGGIEPPQSFRTCGVDIIRNGDLMVSAARQFEFPLITIGLSALADSTRFVRG